MARNFMACAVLALALVCFSGRGGAVTAVDNITEFDPAQTFEVVSPNMTISGDISPAAVIAGVLDQASTLRQAFLAGEVTQDEFEAGLNAILSGLTPPAGMVTLTAAGGTAVPRPRPMVHFTNGQGNGLALTDIRFVSVRAELVSNYNIGWDIYGGGGLVSAGSLSSDSVLGELAGVWVEDVEIACASAVGPELRGGGVVGAFSNSSGAASVGDISGSLFSGIATTVGSSGSSFAGLYGGGVVGAYSFSGSVSVGDVSGSLFSGIATTVESSGGYAMLIGGGVVGEVSISSSASIGAISATIFNDVATTVESSGTYADLSGGGVVGAFSGVSSASLGAISDTIFSDIATTVESSGTYADLSGGGVVGVYSGGSSATIGAISGTMFSSIATTVESSGTFAALSGGGVVGAFSGSSASLGVISDTIFSDIATTVESSGSSFAELYGGGVVGAYSYSSASIGALSDSIFNDIATTVESSGTSAMLYGGGVVGAYTSSSVSIGALSDTIFNDIATTVESSGASAMLYGGGVVGAYASSSSSSVSIGALSDTIFNDIATTVESSGIYAGLSGGGVVGASSSSSASIGALSDSMFSNIATTVESSGNASSQFLGGGVVGASSGSSASLGVISDTIFSNIATTVESSGNASAQFMGGGVVGAYSGSSSIGAISDSQFSGITTTVQSSDAYAIFYGGGAIGAFAYGSLACRASIGGITGSLFTRIDTSVTGVDADSAVLYSGVIYSSGLNEELVISDSAFVDNTASSNGRVYAGAIGIDTSYGSDNPDGHTLTLAAGAGERTLFYNNRIIDAANPAAAGATNAVYFGNMAYWNGNSFVSEASQANAVLVIAAGVDGEVILADPMRVELTDADGGSSVANAMSFAMTVASPGRFYWGGDNLFTVTGTGSSSLDFLAGSRVEFQSDFRVSGDTAANLAIDVDRDTAMSFNLYGRDQTMAAFADYAGGIAFTGDASKKVAIQGTYYGFDRRLAGESWKITENGEMVAANFTPVASQWFDTALASDGNSITVDNSRVFDYIDANANLSSAQRSGGLQSMWENVFDKVPEFLIDEYFEKALTSTDIADQHQNLALFAVDTAYAVWQQAKKQNADSYDLWESATASLNAGSESGLASLTCVPQRRIRLWAGYIGSHAKQNSVGGVSGYSATWHGVATGISADLSQAVSVGGYYAYTDGRVRHRGLGGRTNSDSHQGGLFGIFRPLCDLTITADIQYAHFDNKLRNITRPGRSDPDQDLFAAGLEFRYDWRFAPGWRLSPYLAARYQHLRQDGLDAGALYQLGINKDDLDSFATSLGAEAAYEGCFAGGRRYRFAVSAAWRHEFGDRELSSSARYPAAMPGFSVRSVRRNRDMFDAGLDFRADIYRGERVAVDVFAGAGLTASRKYLSETWRVGVGVTF